MLWQTVFLRENEALKAIKLLLSGITDSCNRIFKLLIMSINRYFNLHHFLFLLFPFLLIGFHLPLQNILNFKIKSHSIIMNRIQNDWLTWILTYVVMNINSYFLYLFLNVILNDFNPLNNDVLKDSLSLFYIYIVLYVFIVKPIH